LTVKGWGVMLNLAGLAWAFQNSHYGLFLVAALSGCGFWLIEGIMKPHQMRYYLRMWEIEVLQYERSTARLLRHVLHRGSTRAGHKRDVLTAECQLWNLGRFL
jgi:hypothetical protein